MRQKQREGSLTSQSPSQAGMEARGPISAIGAEGSSSRGKEKEDDGVPVTDPLEGMSEIDRWGIKGLRTLMQNYPDYNSMIMGMDPTTFGMESSEE